jgi:phage baseplate assembly protein W
MLPVLKKQIPINNFMASIVIDTLKVKDNNKPIYSDIKLDLKVNYNIDPRLESKDVIMDIESSHDLDAIKNSLFNLFTTVPGQKILNPVYGLNLLQFVFTGITSQNANALGNLILEGIRRFEPRIEIKKINVFPDMENQTFEIGLRLDVPSLNIKDVTLKGVLSESGYYFN